jgi:hypothetical protein
VLTTLMQITYCVNACLSNDAVSSKIIQGVPEGKDNILGGHSIGHSKRNSVYVHVSYSEMFPRWSYFTVQ